MSSFNVRSLQELAFYNSFKEILATLLLCPGHRFGGDRLNLASSSVFLNNNWEFFKSENIRKIVKGRLRHILVGTMSDETRLVHIFLIIFYF